MPKDNTMAQKPSIIVKGEARYIWLARPDTMGDKPAYKVELVLDADEAKPFIEIINEALTNLPKAKRNGAKKPYKKLDDGRIALKFRTKYQPLVVDTRNNKLDPAKLRIGNGSILKVKALVDDFENKNGCGVALRPGAVMVVKLVEYTGSGGFSDDEMEDEGFTAEEVEEGEATRSGAASDNADDDDDL